MKYIHRFLSSRINYWGFLFILFFCLSFITIYYNFIHNGLISIGNDTNFHTLRIEDYTIALKSGHLFTFINNIALYSTGYAAPIFYSNFFLLPAAIFHLFIPMAPTVILFLILINLTTFYIAYWSFYRCFYQRSSALLFSLFFTLSTYRLAEIAPRFAIGELIALTFLPLAFSALYRIIIQQHDDWFYLSLGASSILLAHHITALIFIIFSILFLIFFWRQITVKVWGSLTKVIISSLLITAFYTVPLVEQLLSQKFYMQLHPVFNIANNGTPLLKIFTDAVHFTNLNQISIGLITLLSLGISWLFLLRLTIPQRNILFIATIFLILCTNITPWSLLTTTPLSYLQFPWRLFTIISLLAAWLVADYTKDINLITLRPVAYISLSFLPIFFMLIAQVVPNSLPKKNYADYNQVYISRNGIQGGEFLPADLNEDYLYRLNQTTALTHHYNRWYFSKNDFNRADKHIPVMWYLGYQVSTTSGKKIPFHHDSGLIVLNNKPSEDITVTYSGTVYQKIAITITFISIAFLFIYKLYSLQE